MSAETETQYNPQYGVRRTIFSDEYDFLTKIESVCVQEDGLHFAVRTWKDRTVKVCVTFLTPSVFRFVMVPELTAQSHRQTVLESTSASEFESKNAKLVETQHYFVYETEQLSLHFEKDYWEMSVYQNGKLLTKEQAFDTNVDNRWKQLPTGFQVDASGKSISPSSSLSCFPMRCSGALVRSLHISTSADSRSNAGRRMRCQPTQRIPTKDIPILQAAADIPSC